MMHVQGKVGPQKPIFRSPGLTDGKFEGRDEQITTYRAYSTLIRQECLVKYSNQPSCPKLSNERNTLEYLRE